MNKFHYLFSIQNICNYAIIYKKLYVKMYPLYSMISMYQHIYKLKHSKGRYRNFYILLHLIYNLIALSFIIRFIIGILFMMKNWSLAVLEDYDPTVYYLQNTLFPKNIPFMITAIPLILYWIVIDYIEFNCLDMNFRDRFNDFYHFSSIFMHMSFKKCLTLTNVIFHTSYDPFTTKLYWEEMLIKSYILELYSKCIISSLFIFGSIMNTVISLLLFGYSTYPLYKNILILIDLTTFIFGTINTIGLSFILYLQICMLYVAKTTPLKIENRKIQRIQALRPEKLTENFINRSLYKFHKMFIFYLKESVEWNQRTVYYYTFIVLTNFPSNVCLVSQLIQKRITGKALIWVYLVIISQTILIIGAASILNKLSKTLVCFSKWIITGFVYKSQLRSSSINVLMKQTNFIFMVHNKKPFRFSFGSFNKISSKILVAAFIYYSVTIIGFLKRLNRNY